MPTIELKSIQEIDRVAHNLLNFFEGHNIVCFYGAMGAGKTTLIRAICKALGVSDIVTSPSFALVNEYTDRNGNPIYHFDFYRIQSIDEVFDFGYEEYFYNPNALCLIEWPELVAPILPAEGVVSIHVTVNPDDTRTIQISSKL